MLHSHLPYVLNHGRWPHGSDWLCEAAVDTYLPLIARLRQLEERRIATPMTIGVTPVLANQLVHPLFAQELSAYFIHRLAACDAAMTSEEPGVRQARDVVLFLRGRLERLRDTWESIGRDIIGELRRLQFAGRIEIATCAATHGLLPLLARDESIRLQLAVGAHEHRRLFGSYARGVWLPECAYRPSGEWTPIPGFPPGRARCGIERFLTERGLEYFFADAHMARAGAPSDMYGELLAPAHGRTALTFAERDEKSACLTTAAGRDPVGAPVSPHQPYQVVGPNDSSVTVFLRHPEASMRVWSRGTGYPGNSAYLEFHKISWPEGLRLWRVTDREGSLGGKQPYDALAARFAARADAADFVSTLVNTAGVPENGRPPLVVTPFDTELFGHWWFEGVDFLGDVFERLTTDGRVRALPASAIAHASAEFTTVSLTAGSWGRDGNFSMWLNDKTESLWQEEWELEERFWTLAPDAMRDTSLHALLAQCARSLLLTQSSDWPFIITTGDAADYGHARFDGHAAETRELLTALETRLAGGGAITGEALAAALTVRDSLFPDVLTSVATVLSLREGDAGRR